MNKPQPKHSFLVLVALCLLFASIACGLSSAPQQDVPATAQALGTRLSTTRTVEAESQEGGSSVQTAEARATERLAQAEATQTAILDLGAEALQATAQFFEPVRAELPKYGVDPEKGRPAWLHPPVILDIDGKNQYDYANQYLGTVAANFVLSTDITWNTQYGGSGCGFAVRSDGNVEALNQYLVVASRGANGHVYLATMVNGEVATGQDIYAYGLDPKFDWRNDTTNRLTVVGRGNSFEIFTNDTRLGEFDPTDPPPQPIFPPPPAQPADTNDPKLMAAYMAARAEYEGVVNQMRAQYNSRLQNYESTDKVFDKGFVAMVAVSESGHTVCQFDNTWLWLLEE